MECVRVRDGEIDSECVGAREGTEEGSNTFPEGHIQYYRKRKMKINRENKNRDRRRL